jgi:multimeric flavodoxin WrbA
MKTLLLNGSPHEKGSTDKALSFVADALGEEGVGTETVHIPSGPVLGCLGCSHCKVKMTRRCVNDDIVNVLLEKMEKADALVIGSPTYFAGPNGHFLSVLDRLFYPSREPFAGKPAAAITVCRRGGATAALDVMQKYFIISGMPVAPSTYWPMIHGHNPSEVVQDEEGVQCMKMLGKTLAWMMKCIAAGKEKGLAYPGIPGGEKILTNFIR